MMILPHPGIQEEASGRPEAGLNSPNFVAAGEECYPGKFPYGK
ncbi:MAG: hypothetical protein R6U51_10505 [Anaerolineales bacterium]